MPYQNPPKACPVCKEKADFKFIQDHKNKQGNWSLYHCSICQAQFWLPFKNPGTVHYERSYIVREGEGTQFLFGYHKKFLNLIKDIPAGTKILEIGFGTGDLLAELAKRGCEVWGMDIDKNGAEFVKKHFKLKNIYAMPDEQFFKLPNLPKFDMIIFFELIEHLDNHLEFIKRISGALKDGGKVVASTPSRERILPNLLECDFPPHHLVRWNEESLSYVFSKAGFEKESVHYADQMKFLLESLNHKLRTGLVLKVAKAAKNKNLGGTSKEVVGGTFLTRAAHKIAYLKDYLVGGLPAVLLLAVSKPMGKKNGDMIMFFKKNKRMETQPKASVVLPTYKRPKFLDRAIRSVLTQTYENFELIVIDDSPDEESKKVALSFNDPRIRYIKNEVKTSLPAARNKGARESGTDSRYIIFLDDDNELFPQFLEKSIAKLEEDKELTAVAPNSRHIFDDGIIIGDFPEVREKWNTGLGNGSVFRKSLFTEENFWFDEKLKRSEEWDFGVRVLKKHKVEPIKYALQKYYHHPLFLNSTLSTVPLSSESMDYLFNKHYSFYKKLGGFPLSLFYSWMGRLYGRAGMHKKARELFLRSFLAKPSFSQFAYYVFWLFPGFAKNFYAENFQHKVLKLKNRIKNIL